MVNENRRGSGSFRRRSSVAPPSELTTPLKEEEIEFDSQDESECEALFMGTWTPAVARDKRRERRFGRVKE